MNMRWILAVLLILASLEALANDTDAMAGAVALYEQRQFDEAEAAFEGLLDSSESAQPPYYLARISEARGELEDAAEYMEQAVERDPGKSEYYYHLGRYYGDMAGEASIFKQMGLAKKSRAGFERAVELDGTNLDARSGLITYLLVAPGIAGGSEEEALVQAQEVARQDPIRGHNELARVYLQMEDLKAAEREYRAAVAAAEPEDPNPTLALGLFLNGQERYEEALDLYRGRLAEYPDDWDIVYQLGRSVSLSGLALDEGQAAFLHYINDHEPTPTEPGLDWAHYRLGLIYERKGETDGARKEFETALALNPEHPEAKKALKRVD